MRRAVDGVGASRGLVLGRARVRQPRALEATETRIAPAEVEGELARLERAVARARGELWELRERLHGAMAHEVSEFIDLHTLILDDPELRAGLETLVREQHCSADYALKLQRDRLAAVFAGMDDPYFRSRREDLDHVIGRIWAALHAPAGARPEGMAGDVLVTDTVAPSELAQLVERGVLAVVTTQGSALSHSAILARSMHLPLVVGAHEVLAHINDGDAMLVDGAQGRVVVEPNAEDLRRFRQAQREDERERRQLDRLRSKATRTTDGVDIRLHGNAETREDVASTFALGASGIGLYRTEFLFLGAALPDEEAQFRAYRDLVLGMGGRPATIRTLDLGADKADSTGLALASEPNPALGVRGVRLSLRQPALFRQQLRAILRASGYGPVRLLVPMVSCCEEMASVRSVLPAVADELRAEGHEVAERIEVGAMIEVPAAALALPRLIRQVDFVSVGTNDLLQYLLAADRNNDALANLYTPLHPGVLRLLNEILSIGRRSGKPVTVCGEMAGDERYTRLLLALGLTDFSMHPSRLLEVRRAVRASDHGALRRRAPALLRAADRAGIERIVDRL